MIAELRKEIADQKEEEARAAFKRTCEINDLADENLKKACQKPEIIPISRSKEQ